MATGSSTDHLAITTDSQQFGESKVTIDPPPKMLMIQFWTSDGPTPLIMWLQFKHLATSLHYVPGQHPTVTWPWFMPFLTKNRLYFLFLAKMSRSKQWIDLTTAAKKGCKISSSHVMTCFMTTTYNHNGQDPLVISQGLPVPNKYCISNRLT